MKKIFVFSLLFSALAAATTEKLHPFFDGFCLPSFVIEGIERPTQAPTPEQEVERQAAWEKACASRGLYTHLKLNNQAVCINKFPYDLLSVKVQVTDVNAWNNFMGNTDSSSDNYGDRYVNALIACNKLPEICDQPFVIRIQIIPNETIRIKQGEPYILELPEVHVPVIKICPTPTYKWKLTTLGKENMVKVEEIGSIRVAFETFFGGAWKITGLTKGSTTIAFDYICSWNNQSVATRIFDFIVE